MAISKLILNGVVQMDTTGSTITNAPQGEKYIGCDGEEHIGSIGTGSATTPATTITANPTINVSNTGLITATASATQSVTPTVVSGIVSSGTAGTITVSGSNTSQLTTQGAQTIHPSTSNQTIASGRYLTGTQTINAVTHNLTADKILQGFTAKIGDSSDDDCVASIAGTASGGSKNVQVAQSTSRTTSTSYTSLCSLTCSTAGTYDVYWTSFRSSTSGTWGTQLYVNGAASGDAQATFSNHIQNVHLTGVTIGANQSVAVYGRSRGSNYYAYVSNLVIIQTA